MANFKDFSQRILERLSKTMEDILHPHFCERIFREIGVSLGREMVSHDQRSDTTAPPFKVQSYLHSLEQMKSRGDWNHEVKLVTKSLINISIPLCPFGKLAADNPHFCQIEAGMLGGIAGDHFGYSKVEIFRSSDVPPRGCSLNVYLEQTPQSMIVEGPSFPLASAGEKQAHRVAPNAKIVAQLSPRERQIVMLIGEGLSDKEVATAFKLSVRTVEGHLARIRRKTGIGSRSALIRWAIRISHDI